MRFLIPILFSTYAVMAHSAEDRQLNGTEIASLIAGNTMQDERGLVEFHTVDGIAAVRATDLKDKMLEFGRWTIKHDALCYKYLTSKDDIHCWRVYRLSDGSMYLWSTVNQVILKIDVVKGDPNKMSRAITPDIAKAVKALR